MPALQVQICIIPLHLWHARASRHSAARMRARRWTTNEACWQNTSSPAPTLYLSFLHCTYVRKCFVQHHLLAITLTLYRLCQSVTSNFSKADSTLVPSTAQQQPAGCSKASQIPLVSRPGKEAEGLQIPAAWAQVAPAQVSKGVCFTFLTAVQPEAVVHLLFCLLPSLAILQGPRLPGSVSGVLKACLAAPVTLCREH